MCGICGIVGNTSRFSSAQFLTMREALHHRGPDDAGAWDSTASSASPAPPHEPHALLGSRRLAILDLSPAGHQPMVDPDSGLVIAYNGEIYNYSEIANELASQYNMRFRSRGDTEVLLKAYATWGRDCLSHLNGMFAFAIWNPRTREVFCARDRFGEKPFYYFLGEDFLAFASEIKSLVAGRFFSPEPDNSAVYGYLANREMDSTSETLFKNVHSLPAAHALTYSPSAGLKIWKYWDIDPAEETRLPTNEAYADRFLELLTDSVRIRLRSDVPLGSSLSGGLDSSTVVGIIAQLGAAQSQSTFSARFNDPRFDEGRYIDKVVAHTHAAPHQVYPDATRLAAEMEDIAWHQDHPFYSSSIYAQWCVMRLAREAGVTVLLDGQGADETLAGYHEFFSAGYRQQLKDLHLFRAAGDLRRYTADHGTAALALIFRSFLPASIKSAATRLVRSRAIPRDFATRHARPAAQVKTRFRHALQHSLYASLTHSVLPQLLRYADRNSMAFSREVRLPFLDHRVVEFLFAIPAEQKISGSTTKIVLRNAIRGIVPEEIRTRKDKLGFAPPEVSWLRGPLNRWVGEVFSSPQFQQREWTNSHEVTKVWKNFQAGRTGLHTSIWRWLSLEMWARVCLKPRTVLLDSPPNATAPAITSRTPIQSIST